MIWLTWRQHRWEALQWAVFAAVMIGWAGVAGLSAQSLIRELDLFECDLSFAWFEGSGCEGRVYEFRRRLEPFAATLIPIPLLFLVPVVASFVGAPLLAREFEQSTHKLAWTQAVTPLRWLSVKVGLFVTALVPVTFAIAQIVVWARPAWSSAPGVFVQFDFTWPALTSHVLFALFVGLAAAASFRRALAAMLVALVVSSVVLFAVMGLLRPQYLPPIVQYGEHAIPQDAWGLVSEHVDAQGERISLQRFNEIQRDFGAYVIRNRGTSATMERYLSEQGIHLRQIYQPAERFWLFQSIEAAIFLTLALLLIGLTVWLIRRRPS